MVIFNHVKTFDIESISELWQGWQKASLVSAILNFLTILYQ